MNMPRTRSTPNMISSITMGARSTLVAHSISPALAPVKARSWLKVDDARMIRSTIAVTLTEPATDFTITSQDSTR